MGELGVRPRLVRRLPGHGQPPARGCREPVGLTLAGRAIGRGVDAGIHIADVRLLDAVPRWMDLESDHWGRTDTRRRRRLRLRGRGLVSPRLVAPRPGRSG